MANLHTIREEKFNASQDDNPEQGFEIGYNPEFERRWWKMEITLWVIITVMIGVGLSGLLGEGPLGKKELGTNDSAVTMRYERIARLQTPSTVTVRIAPQAFRNSSAYVWLNRAFINDLGVRRISPEPLRSIPDANGIGYEFATQDHQSPVVIIFSLQPARVGIFHDELRTDPQHDLFARSIILP